MKRCLLVAVMSLCGAAAHADTMIETTVFDRGEGGYAGYRIPAIVQAQNGTILAFAEARKNSLSDYGDVDLVVKRSHDGGQTWGPIQFIADNGSEEAGNPCVVVDQDTGNVIVMYTEHFRNPHVSVSTNNGLTWSTPVDITSTIKPSTWDTFYPGPGHGIQLERGPNAGRIVIPSYHVLEQATMEPDGREMHITYSDDGGATWYVGGILQNPTYGIGPGEPTVTELVDGRLYVNTRNQGDYSRHRLTGYSEDGGLSFTDLAAFDYGLIDPKVQGSVVRYSAVDMGDSRNRILFSNPRSQDARINLHVRSSFDESLTWNEGKLINRGQSAYSDLVTLNTGMIGVLYEWGDTKNYEEVRFATFSEQWLDSPTALHYDFDPANLSGVGGDLYVDSVDGYDYRGQADGYMTTVAGSPDYKGEGALRFNEFNTGDTIRALDATQSINLEFTHTDSFTIEAVFRTTKHSNSTGTIFEKSEAGDTDGSYALEVVDGNLRFRIRDIAGNEANLLDSTVVNDGYWHHVAAVRDALAQRLYLYIDHVFVGMVREMTTGDFGGNRLSQAEAPAIGSAADGLNQFGGDLQHLRISMAALSHDQFIQKLAIIGDLNSDGFVGIEDLNLVLSSWNHVVVPGNLLQGDPTGDGFVGIEDLNVVLGNWNANTPATADATIPEPAGVCLFLIAGVGLMRRRYS